MTSYLTADAVARMGRHWGWSLAFGILTLAAGVAALVWPGVTILALAVLLGPQLVVAGVSRFVTAPAGAPGTRRGIVAGDCSRKATRGGASTPAGLSSL
jgi:hypothetical protein